MYSVLDLFSGAGGLSLGFQQTNKFKVKIAFENNINAQNTYTKNHCDVIMFDDVKNARYEQIKKQYGEIDVIIGGPPCQGFSNANRQKNYAISQNNMLVKEYIRAIIELQPKAFVMENVGMLKSKTHVFYVTHNDINDIKEYSIKTHNTHIHLLDEEYCFEGILELVSDIKAINANLWDVNTYKLINNLYRHKNNKKKLELTVNKYKEKLKIIAGKLIEELELKNAHISNADIVCGNSITKYLVDSSNEDQLIFSIEEALMLQRMLGKALELHNHGIVVKEIELNPHLAVRVESFSVYDYLVSVLGAPQNGYSIDSGVLNAAEFGVPQKRMRFVVMGIKKALCTSVRLPEPLILEGNFASVRDAIEDLSHVDPVYSVGDDLGILIDSETKNLSKLAKELRNSDVLHNHIITENREIALKRFAAIKQGQNFHSLDSSMKENTYTDASRTQNTIYLRVGYDEPSGTVVNVRKSMWIHPEHNRAISVREAARLQSFPDSYIFVGTKDSQYQQVGNAVPPMLARAIAEKLAALLDGEKLGNCNFVDLQEDYSGSFIK